MLGILSGTVLKLITIYKIPFNLYKYIDYFYEYEYFLT